MTGVDEFGDDFVEIGLCASNPTRTKVYDCYTHFEQRKAVTVLLMSNVLS